MTAGHNLIVTLTRRKSFMRIPANTPHYAWSETEAVVQVNGVGPFDLV